MTFQELLNEVPVEKTFPFLKTQWGKKWRNEYPDIYRQVAAKLLSLTPRLSEEMDEDPFGAIVIEPGVPGGDAALVSLRTYSGEKYGTLYVDWRKLLPLKIRNHADTLSKEEQLAAIFWELSYDFSFDHAGVAQLAERFGHIEEATGSSPVPCTKVLRA